MPKGEDLWGSAGGAAARRGAGDLRQDGNRRPAWSAAERREPLTGSAGPAAKSVARAFPGLAQRVVVVVGVLSLAGLAIAIPAAVRTGYEVADAAREVDRVPRRRDGAS